MSNDEWRNTYIQLLLEQDEESPHRYIKSNRIPDSNTIFADLGAAEGFLALDFIDKVKKIYLFECDPDWIEALKMTFGPWENKVEIVNRYVSDVTSEKTVSLDDFFWIKISII